MQRLFPRDTQCLRAVIGLKNLISLVAKINFNRACDLLVIIANQNIDPVHRICRICHILCSFPADTPILSPNSYKTARAILKKF